MPLFFSIVVIIALHVIPAGVNVFEIVDPGGRTVNGAAVDKVVRFTKTDNGWQAVDLPRDELGTYILENRKLKVAPPEDERKRGNSKVTTSPTMDFMFKNAKQIDWSSITKIDLNPRGQVSISREPNAVSVKLTYGSGERLRQQSFLIRWKENENE